MKPTAGTIALLDKTRAGLQTEPDGRIQHCGFRVNLHVTLSWAAFSDLTRLIIPTSPRTCDRFWNVRWGSRIHTPWPIGAKLGAQE